MPLRSFTPTLRNKANFLRSLASLLTPTFCADCCFSRPPLVVVIIVVVSATKLHGHVLTSITLLNSKNNNNIQVLKQWLYIWLIWECLLFKRIWVCMSAFAWASMCVSLYMSAAAHPLLRLIYFILIHICNHLSLFPHKLIFSVSHSLNCPVIHTLTCSSIHPSIESAIDASIYATIQPFIQP